MSTDELLRPTRAEAARDAEQDADRPTVVVPTWCSDPWCRRPRPHQHLINRRL